MALSHDILTALEEKREVKLLRDVLKDGDHQAVDLGTHGWFRLYTVRKIKTPSKTFKKPIPVKTFRKVLDDDPFATEFRPDPLASPTANQAQGMAHRA